MRLFCFFQRAQPEELEKIKKHYETSDEEQVKLLDKPEQWDIPETHQITLFFMQLATSDTSVVTYKGCVYFSKVPSFEDRQRQSSVFNTTHSKLTDVHCFSLTGSCMNSPRSLSFPVEFTVSFFSRSSLTPLPPFSARPRLFFTSARYKGTFQRGQTSDTIKHLIKYQCRHS